MTVAEIMQDIFASIAVANQAMLEEEQREMRLLKMDYLAEFIGDGWIECPWWYEPAWYAIERHGFDFRKCEVE